MSGPVFQDIPCDSHRLFEGNRVRLDTHNLPTFGRKLRKVRGFVPVAVLLQ